jgi:hypothetical protein
MDNGTRYRELLLNNKARAIELIRMGFRIRQSTRDVGIGRAIFRAIMLPPLGLFLLMSAWLLEKLDREKA